MYYDNINLQNYMELVINDGKLVEVFCAMTVLAFIDCSMLTL